MSKAITELRPCLVNERKAYFHKWVDFSKPIPAGLTVGSAPAGIIAYTLGLVEYENGEVTEVNPNSIRFLDRECSK